MRHRSEFEPPGAIALYCFAQRAAHRVLRFETLARRDQGIITPLRKEAMVRNLGAPDNGTAGSVTSLWMR